MKAKSLFTNPDLATEKQKPVPVAGFTFLKYLGDYKRTMKSNIIYRPAEISNTGSKWFVFYYFRDPVTQKMKRFKAYEDINRIRDLKYKQEFAEMLRDAVNLALKEGFNPFDKKEKHKNWTLNQCLNLYKQKMPELDLRPRTQGAYLSMVNILQSAKADFINKDISTLEKDGILSLYGSLKKIKDWSNTTYNNNLGHFSTFLNWCVKGKMLKENPLQGLEKRKETPEKNKAYTDAEYKRLFEYLTGNLYWFCKFVYYTGTRPIQETRYLKMGMVDFDKKQLAIPGKVSKNKTSDRIPLADELVGYLEPFRDCPPEWYIFTKEGKPGPVQSPVNYFTNQFVKVREALGLDKNNGIYSLKATRTIHMAEAGVDPYQIMKLWRHSSLEMTLIYLRGLGVGISRDAVNVVK